MHSEHLHDWQHSHVFGQDQQRAGERRTLWVVGLTAVMMVVEITAGIVYGSMALLADGLHMASHTTALGIAVFAYVLSRRLAADRRFSFGVGKINSLAGFASAVLLLGFAGVMAMESIGRMINPTSIAFDQALVVAVVGLVVNGASAWLLVSTPHGHDHDHRHDHDHGQDHGHDHGHSHEHDHNLRAAYLHVVADALTSVLAIVALLAGKFYGANWLDPAMGIVGAVLVARWSLGLIRASGAVLLDAQAPSEEEAEVTACLQRDSDDRVTDLHLWQIGPGLRAAEIALVSDAPRTPEQYKALLPASLNIVHALVEVHACPGHAVAGHPGG